MRQAKPARGTRRSIHSADYQRVPRPVAAMARDLPPAYEIAWHSHPRCQLVFGALGVMRVDTRTDTWVVPPQRALWVPPQVEHRILTSGLVQFRTLYISEEAAARMPAVCTAFAVTPLLRELVLRATDLPVEYDEAGADGRVMQLILDELAALSTLASSPANASLSQPMNLPMPATPVLERICRAYLARPNERATLEELGARHGTTTRTLARHFRRETGMSFSEWRRRARLLRALGWIAEGRSILSVALDLGYDSPSAFSAMFRREFGLPPSRYLRGEPAAS